MRAYFRRENASDFPKGKIILKSCHLLKIHRDFEVLFLKNIVVCYML